MLFFGCRNKAADNFFDEEWKTFVRKAQLIFFTAFSRDQVSYLFIKVLNVYQNFMV